jgi:hypothetical protein
MTYIHRSSTSEVYLFLDPGVLRCGAAVPVGKEARINYCRTVLINVLRLQAQRFTAERLD